MRKFFLKALLVIGLATSLPVVAQTTSQLSVQTITVGFNGLSLSSASALYTNAFQQLFLPFVQGNLTYGANGVGAGCANQYFLGQFLITNGALSGTNYINLNNMKLGSGTAPSDAVGNTFAIQNIKCMVLQNAGLVSGANVETNVLILENPPGAVAWTNNSGIANWVTTLPSPVFTAATSNTPTAFNWNGGDVGWPVLSATDNTILLTNPNPGTVLKANLYIIASTNQ